MTSEEGNQIKGGGGVMEEGRKEGKEEVGGGRVKQLPGRRRIWPNLGGGRGVFSLGKGEVNVVG